MSKNKKIIIPLFILIIFLMVILILFAILLNNNQNNKPSNYSSFNLNTSELIKDKSGKDVSPSIMKFMNELNDERLNKKQKYESLEKLTDYLFSLYGITHNPDIRNYVNKDINQFAKSEFPEFYNKNAFNLSCADPECGNQMDNELRLIIEELNNNKNIPPEYKRVISNNITTIAYIPDNEIQGIEAGVDIAINQLARMNDNSASKSADRLRTYVKNKYNLDL